MITENSVIDRGGVRGRNGKLINAQLVRPIEGSGAPTLTPKKGSEEDENRGPLIRQPGQAGLPEYLLDD
jgi:hypothetical protein